MNGVIYLSNALFRKNETLDSVPVFEFSCEIPNNGVNRPSEIAADSGIICDQTAAGYNPDGAINEGKRRAMTVFYPFG